MAPQFGFDGCEEVRGIQLVVAQELEHVTMKAVGTRLGDGIHHRATEFSVLRVKAVCNQAELLDRIEIRNKSRAEISPLADIASIHQECVGCLPLAIH